MAYDKTKDIEIANEAIQCDNDKELQISVYSYNGNEAKLQIGPRTYVKKNGEMGYGKAGRLTLDEVDQLIEILPRLREQMMESV
jgi:hypothetical protein